MRAGKLDRTITIDRKTDTVLPSGATTSAWTIIATVRAEVVTQTATEFLTGFGEAEDGTIIFRARYIAGLTTTDRVSYNGRAYALKEITEIGRRKSIELRAVAS